MATTPAPAPGLLDPDLAEKLRKLSPDYAAYVLHRIDWLSRARAEQVPPAEAEQTQWLTSMNLGYAPDNLKARTPDPSVPWTEFGAQAGRGFGKTRMGAEWLLQAAWEDPKALPRCIVAPTQQDVRMTCFEGESGLLNIIPPECVANYNRTELVLTLTNGAMLRGFSAEKADRLRGPQHADAWCTPGDTRVRMADGTDRRVDSVRAGEFVLTRKGPRRVLMAGQSGNPNPQVCISCGPSRLTATEDHPVFTQRGWVPAGDLRADDVLCVLTSQERERPAVSMLAVKAVEKLTTRVPVHCLKVEGEPEYFAEGILVHNCDELAGWGPDGEDVFDMLMFGMRLGDRPRIVWTSTPKPNALIRRLTAPKAGRIIVRGSTFDNRANLPDSFFKQLEAYDGTKLGRQELYGELLDPEEAGIIRRSWLRLWPADKPLPSFQWIIMSLDTAFTERTLDKKGDADPTACGVFGVFTHEKRTNVMLLDCWEDHLGLPELTRRVRKEMNNRYGDDEDDAVIKPLVGSPKPIGSGRKPDILLIEDKGSGISLRQTLAEQGVEAYAYNPGRADKLSRLHIVSPIFAQRRVWLPESNKMPGKPRNWCEPLIAQLCSFTGEGSVKHDDYVDVVTQAVRLMMDKQMLALVKPPEERRDYTPPPPPDYSNPYDI